MIGNIVPLIIFALVLELALLPQDVFAAFLASGVISAFIFGALNPATALIGGSAAVAGVVGAALFTRPAWSILAILLLPAAMSYAIMPAAQYLTTEHAVTLVQQTQAIQQNVTTLVQQNRTEEARELNKTLVVVEKKAEVVTKGIEREQKTPTEIPVHVYGFFVGIAYVLAFRRNEVKRGASELLVLKDAAVKILRGLRGLLGL
jgi:energy-converting hydrogenase Eha subunit C